MTIPRWVYMALGAGAVSLVGGKGKGMGMSMRGLGGSVLGGGVDLHDVAVRVTAAGMRAADVVGAAVQSVADEASDINAEARQKARVDALVRERLADVEQDIRAEVLAAMEDDEASFDYDE